MCVSDLEDAFDALSLRVFSFLAVQLSVRVTDELQQPLCLDVYQHRVLKSTAVLRERFETALSHPLLKRRRTMDGAMERRTVFQQPTLVLLINK